MKTIPRYKPKASRLLISLCCAALITTSLFGDAETNPAVAANGSVQYTYDALGRVTTASYDTNVLVIYSYDANGNRTQQVINVNTATLQWSATACTTNCWGTTLWGS